MIISFYLENYIMKLFERSCLNKHALAANWCLSNAMHIHDQSWIVQNWGVFSDRLANCELD